VTATFNVIVNMGALPLAIRQELQKPVMVAYMQRRAITYAAPYVQYELTQATPVGATALLRQSNQVVLSELGTLGWVGPIGAASLYAGFVVSGTRPHWPNVGAIAYWTSRVLGYPLGSKENDRVAYLVGRAISRRGTRPKEYVRKAADAAQPRVTSLMLKGIHDALMDIQ
jgi:hypothetical protein